MLNFQNKKASISFSEKLKSYSSNKQTHSTMLIVGAPFPKNPKIRSADLSKGGKKSLPEIENKGNKQKWF